MKLLCFVLITVGFAVYIETCERHGAKCPQYTVLHTNEEYEERRYPSMVWISVSGHGKSKSDVSRKLIKQLYSYLGGDNDQEKKIDMMVPVRTTKLVQDGSNLYTMAVTIEQHENVPRPLNPHISVNMAPETTYVVRSFGGYARQDSMWDAEADSLKQSVASDGAVNTTYYYMSVYDSPWTETDRLNEVWMKKEN